MITDQTAVDGRADISDLRKSYSDFLLSITDIEEDLGIFLPVSDNFSYSNILFSYPTFNLLVTWIFSPLTWHLL